MTTYKQFIFFIILLSIQTYFLSFCFGADYVVNFHTHTFIHNKSNTLRKLNNNNTYTSNFTDNKEMKIFHNTRRYFDKYETSIRFIESNLTYAEISGDSIIFTPQKNDFIKCNIILDNFLEIRVDKEENNKAYKIIIDLISQELRIYFEGLSLNFKISKIIY